MRGPGKSLSRLTTFTKRNVLPLEIVFLLWLGYGAYLDKSVPWLELLVIAPVVYMGRQEWYRRRQREHRAKGGCCLQCGYDLHGNTSGACPGMRDASKESVLLARTMAHGRSHSSAMIARLVVGPASAQRS